MNKRIWSLAVLIVATLSARSTNAQQRYIGVTVGANFASESLDAQPGGVSISDRTGFLAGLVAERWFSSQWGISEQLLYAQEGRNTNINGAGTGVFYGIATTGNETIETRYLDVTVLLKRTIWGNNAIRTYAFVGPGVGVFLSGNDHYNVIASQHGSATFTEDTSFSLYSIVNTFDFSILFGVGVSVKLNSGLMFFCEASYWYGLTNIFESYGGTTYTRDIRIAAGVLFPLY
jgi:hypothetical protein